MSLFAPDGDGNKEGHRDSRKGDGGKEDERRTQDIDKLRKLNEKALPIENAFDSSLS